MLTTPRHQLSSELHSKKGRAVSTSLSCVASFWHPAEHQAGRPSLPTILSFSGQLCGAAVGQPAQACGKHCIHPVFVRSPPSPPSKTGTLSSSLSPARRQRQQSVRPSGLRQSDPLAPPTQPAPRLFRVLAAATHERPPHLPQSLQYACPLNSPSPSPCPVSPAAAPHELPLPHLHLQARLLLIPRPAPEVGANCWQEDF